ncbi:unnamed protein product [Prorocentrum cordatum]|uniref:Uncharacterized protein n=1 Tax=Prorocentrum cordatum TaxID=2364126 RepID=A0ABN9TPE3_9DINO|nr:unnamed protein product [Polarella glacialis]
MADKYAGWGAEHGALDPAIIAQQQIRDQIATAVQNRLLAIDMAVTVVHVSHKTQFTHGWLWCEKCGGTSYLGDHKSRIVAGVARKLARPCQPPTAAGRRVLADMQRGKLPRGAKPAADPVDEVLNEITMPGDFKLGLSNHEAIDLDGGSSEAGGPQPAPQQPPSHPHSVVHASWRLVDHMQGYAGQWMNMVDQEVWDDMDDWMEHCVPFLLAITNVGGGADTQEQTRAVTVQELQQIKDFCEEVWRNTHRTRRRPMTRMLALPHGTRQQAARVHMDAFQNRRNNILAHSIPSSERRPLPRTAEASREWSPENLDDDDSTPDSEAPELEGEPSNQEMETMAGPDQRHDANSLMQTAVQVAVTLTKPVGPDLMKFVSEADEAGLLHPRLRHNKGEADQDPEQEVAWLERNRLEQLMQSLAGCWSQKEGEQGWPSRQAACVPHVLRALQTGVYQRLFSNVSGPSRQRSQRRAAEEICRLARLNSGEARRQIQQQDPKEAERRRAMAEQFLGVTEPVVRSRRRSTMDMADLDHFLEEENSEDCLQQPVDKQDSDDNHQQIPDAQHSIGYHLADRRGPQRGEGLGRGGPQRGEGLGLDRSATKGKQRLEAEVPDEPSEHDADLLTNSVVDRTSQLTERTDTLGNRQTEREGEGLARGYHVNREHSEWHSRGTSPEPVGSSTEDGDSARLGVPPRGEGLGCKTAQPETTADYDDTDLQRDLEKFFGDFPQRGEGLDRMEPLRGEGLGHGNPLRGEGVDRSAKGKQRLEAEVVEGGGRDRTEARVYEGWLQHCWVHREAVLSERAPRGEELRESVLNIALGLGKTVIVTNANMCWVRATANLFIPSVVPMLKLIDVMSARQSYERQWPGDPGAWKKQVEPCPGAPPGQRHWRGRGRRRRRAGPRRRKPRGARGLARRDTGRSLRGARQGGGRREDHQVQGGPDDGGHDRPAGGRLCAAAGAGHPGPERQQGARQGQLLLLSEDLVEPRGHARRGLAGARVGPRLPRAASRRDHRICAGPACAPSSRPPPRDAACGAAHPGCPGPGPTPPLVNARGCPAPRGPQLAALALNILAGAAKDIFVCVGMGAEVGSPPSLEVNGTRRSRRPRPRRAGRSGGGALPPPAGGAHASAESPAARASSWHRSDTCVHALAASLVRCLLFVLCVCVCPPALSATQLRQPAADRTPRGRCAGLGVGARQGGRSAVSAARAWAPDFPARPRGGGPVYRARPGQG